MRRQEARTTHRARSYRAIGLSDHLGNKGFPHPMRSPSRPARGTRRLRDGREVDIGRNDGLRTVCRCARHRWAKCPHAWHFSFQWEGEHYRFSLERHIGKKLPKADAEVRDVLPAGRDSLAPMAGRGLGDARTDESCGEGQDASRAPATDFQSALGRPGDAKARSFGQTVSAGRVRLGEPAPKASHVDSHRVKRARGGRAQGIPASGSSSRSGVPARRGRRADYRRLEVPRHRNLNTTTRYLNTTSRRLRLALLRVEQARAQSESLADPCKETPESLPHADDAEASSAEQVTAFLAT